MRCWNSAFVVFRDGFHDLRTDQLRFPTHSALGGLCDDRVAVVLDKAGPIRVAEYLPGSGLGVQFAHLELLLCDATERVSSFEIVEHHCLFLAEAPAPALYK